ncbi:hypothetical protein LTR37_015312 [Vermiconidia calcicola]|uniref:Uncharacterized protein n=1 Tax=Vermiconidia calcicola TaxID=1690605 RepID=A0ACC3MQZ5_9PEZI|nr:hypothetical protein LTR37_015312 [Vermiconidia calcicola]
MIQSANIVAFAAKLTFTLAATFTRLSLISFYYRLIKDSGVKWFSWVLHVSMAYTIAVCVKFVALTIWLCSPVESYWIFPPIAGHCLSEGKTMLGGGIINSVSDLLTTILPIPLVMRLQMPLKQRIGVCVLLCLGMIVTIAGAIRTYYSWKSLLDSWDETWYAYPLWIAAAVELDLGLICSCAPAWKALLQNPIKQLSSKLSSLRSSQSNSPNSSAAAKPTTFNPLRSLPWFQVTRFDFQRTQYDGDEFPLQDLEKGTGTERGIQQKAGATDPWPGEETARPATPALQIHMRQSLDQSSTRLGESPVQPSEWLSEGSSKKSSPQQ